MPVLLSSVPYPHDKFRSFFVVKQGFVPHRLDAKKRIGFPRPPLPARHPVYPSPTSDVGPFRFVPRIFQKKII